MTLLSVVIVRDLEHDFVPDGLPESFKNQTLSTNSYEIVVPIYNDGDLYEPFIQEYQELGINVKFFYTKDTARSKLTNQAISQCAGDFILFLAEDFLPTKDVLKYHYQAHCEDSRIDLTFYGPARFSDMVVQNSDFAKWLDESGEIFGINFTRPISKDTFYFYFGNSSIKRSLLEKIGPINEILPFPCQDDANLGKRMKEFGVEGNYLEKALAIHDHDLDEEERNRAMFQAGYSSGLLANNFFAGLKLLLRQTVKLILAYLRAGGRNQIDLWRLRLQRNYLKGIISFYLK